MKNILITAYDIDPYKGSESATGWNYPLNLSKNNNVTVVTRNNNLPNIKKYIFENNLNEENLNFIGFDLPNWAMFWKRKARGSFLYYYLWQFFLALNMLSRKDEFDVCHALNFHCDWAPSFLWLLRKPLVWGPINHNERLPDYIVSNLSFKSKFNERLKYIFKLFFWKLDPFLNLCKFKSSRILVGHHKVIERLNLDSSKCVLFNQIATEMPDKKIKRSNQKFSVLFVGRGLLIKNYSSVIESFILAFESNPKFKNNVELNLVGVGAKGKKEIDKLLQEFNSKLDVNVVEWVEYTAVSEFYKNADVFCFPSYEGAGMVIAEALSYSLPVITIDRNGASHELDNTVSFVVSSENRKLMIEEIANSLVVLASDDCLREQMSINSYFYASSKLSWKVKSDTISQIYNELKFRSLD